MRVFVTIEDGGSECIKRHFWSIAPGRYYATASVNDGANKTGFGTAYHNDPYTAEYKATRKALKDLHEVEQLQERVTKNYYMPPYN